MRLFFGKSCGRQRPVEHGDRSAGCRSDETFNWLHICERTQYRINAAVLMSQNDTQTHKCANVVCENLQTSKKLPEFENRLQNYSTIDSSSVKTEGLRGVSYQVATSSCGLNSSSPDPVPKSFGISSHSAHGEHREKTPWALWPPCEAGGWEHARPKALLMRQDRTIP